MKSPLLPVALLPLLMACQLVKPPDTREGVDFAADARILRGMWTGQVPLDAARLTPITLNLSATYVADSYYKVSGTVALDAQTFEAEGQVNGMSQYKYLKPQTSPIPSGLTLKLNSLPERWISCPTVVTAGGAVTWKCFYDRAKATTVSFDLTKGNS